MSEKISVEVSSIRLEEETETPIMLLQKPNTNQVLPIWIGTIEAVSIAYAQEGFVHPRPQTHDLLLNILESLNAKILEVSITDIHDKTYFAEIKLSTHEGELTLSSRPSDAIALALRSSAEIFVENSVFNDNFIEIYDENNVDIEEFSQFIDNVSPEDFS
jgi:bifunctional DNase/RNase